ncbi:hypothetical protein CIHG_02253 [Coccidioides immitis H538.4]|uniref:Uncharacterized protein n=3 Tax=Coccidioides immitis TaxID=5501 RepID=A0A0J8R6L5_COCIT|nr:hypothetical protein CIRG_00424 [Coccidioides immitis RMSCC 2394]KMU80659.1 hypothetical protein CISG_08649 [Coccidioides immitis RMSCC 3703]KMU84469.1 hypothetical protein CIHG_02253 [Coccidioides immitis H538.4]
MKVVPELCKGARRVSGRGLRRAKGADGEKGEGHLAQRLILTSAANNSPGYSRDAIPRFVRFFEQTSNQFSLRPGKGLWGVRSPPPVLLSPVAEAAWNRPQTPALGFDR